MLLQNISLNNQYPYRRSGATATNTETGYMLSQHGVGGHRQFHRFMSFAKGAGFPSGYNPGLFMPLKHSWISSMQESVCTMQLSGSALMGLPTSGTVTLSFSGSADILPLDDTPMNNIGTASFTVSFANADGQLITSGNGASSFIISCNTPLMLASLNGAGASTFSIYTDNVLLSGEASISANGIMAFSATANILPEDDTSPLRTAATTFSFLGSLEPFAYGELAGEAFFAGGAIDEFAILGRMEYDNAVHIHVTNGQPGTKDPIGTRGFPVNNIADALAIARNLNLNDITLLSDLTLVSGDDVTKYKIKSEDWKVLTIETGTITTDTVFEKLSIYGELSGTWNVCIDCWVYDVTNFLGWVRGGSIERIELAPYLVPDPFSLGSSYFDDLVPMYADITSTIIMNTAVSVSLTGCSDIVTIENCVDGCVINASMMGGKLVIDSSCTGGNINVLGTGLMENNSLVDVIDAGLNNENTAWGAIASDNNTIGTTGNKLNTASSGGVDLNALAEAVRTELESTTIPTNIKKINDVTIQGTGVTDDKWRPV